MECEYQIDSGKSVAEQQIRTSFLDLNDHCLLQVCSYLELWDMINLSRTCKRLETVSAWAAIQFRYFSMVDYVDYYTKGDDDLVKRRSDMVSVMRLISPVIERLDFDSIADRGKVLCIFKKFDFSKLKSLAVFKSNQLQWINNRNNIKELTISKLNQSDLNEFLRDMTELKRIKLGSVSDGENMGELFSFLEKNPNIECLQLCDELKCSIGEDFFEKFKNLKILELTLGNNYRDLGMVLQVTNLTKLTLTLVRFNIVDDGEFVRAVGAANHIKMFLKTLVPRKTLKSLDLKCMKYDDELIDILASLNLDSLRLIDQQISFNDFTTKLQRHSFATLRHLDIIKAPVDPETLYHLITHSMCLERMYLSLLAPYDRDTFLEKLGRLLMSMKNTKRPDLVIYSMVPLMKIEIFFNRRYYQIKTKVAEEHVVGSSNWLQ
ncbi:uncharacterized protein LOC119074631 [Bradysia coprophila]|uniref:uncharacterized protein LOC119074631 n=1 Tax=Bradysia coprophila TaxID=38358 RepID=UPI00187DD644|nr:uncharacterized protein LOC119074631 [Bradysia coprophila]